MIKKILLVLCTLICVAPAGAKINIDIDFNEADLKNKLALAAEKKEATKPEESQPPQENQKQKKRKPRKSKKTSKIKFNFKDTPLVKIINTVAAKKGINIVFPQGANAIKNTITFKQKQKISLALAEQYIHTFLNLAGYSMNPDNGFFVITKNNDNTATRQPLHLYVNLAPESLPQGEERIRAIYYLANFKVPQTTQGNEPLNLILKDMLGTKKGYLFDPKSNAIILTGSADKIASVMTIILELDNSGSPETIEVFQLFNSTASTVAKLLNEQIIAAGKTNKSPGRGSAHAPSGLYFSPNTRVTADTRTNSLILIGTESAVTRIKEFVRDYMDKAPETGESILHVYDLQYLNSKEFAGVLQKLFQKSSTGQSQKDGGGSNRFFEDVIVIAEEEQEVKSKEVGSGSAVKGAKGKVTVGGNRLVIAARKDDWIQIKQLIEQLDKPQLQVIIEVMILDISLEGDKLLQAQTRNPKILDLHENIEFQTAHVQAQIQDSATPQTLAPDLLRLLGDSSMAVPETSDSGVGSMIISLKDSCDVKANGGINQGIWGVLKLLDKWVERKVISHPFIVTKNNVKGKESITDIRRAVGELRNDQSSTTTTLQQDYKAVLAIEVTPRISSMERLNLQIKVEIEDFVGAIGFNRTVRSIETNANLGSGEMLVLGGLTKTTDTETETKMPILGDLPIIGTLFKGTAKAKRKNNLVVFIHPTVVDPKLRAGQKLHTDTKIAQEFAELNSNELFSNSKDPITRFFFKDDASGDATSVLTDYLKNNKYQEESVSSSYKPIDHNINSSGGRTDELKELLKKAKNPFNRK